MAPGHGGDVTTGIADLETRGALSKAYCPNIRGVVPCAAALCLVAIAMPGALLRVRSACSAWFGVNQEDFPRPQALAGSGTQSVLTRWHAALRAVGCLTASG